MGISLLGEVSSGIVATARRENCLGKLPPGGGGAAERGVTDLKKKRPTDFMV